MSTSKTRLEKIQDIINRADLSTMSVKWWEKEMDDTMSKIDKWELSDDYRADAEINKLEKELDGLLKEMKDEEKGKNKKKGNRKKGI